MTAKIEEEKVPHSHQGKDEAIAALEARVQDELAQMVAIGLRAALERAEAAGASIEEILQALANAGCSLDRQRFEQALAGFVRPGSASGAGRGAPTDPPDPVSGFAPGYGSGQF